MIRCNFNAEQVERGCLATLSKGGSQCEGVGAAGEFWVRGEALSAAADPGAIPAANVDQNSRKTSKLH